MELGSCYISLGKRGKVFFLEIERKQWLGWESVGPVNMQIGERCELMYYPRTLTWIRRSQGETKALNDYLATKKLLEEIVT